MIKRTFVLALVVGFTTVISSAQEMQDIFDKNTKITWLGLDFTGAKLIGDRERLGSTSDVMHLIEAWNDLIIKEREKFDVAKAIQKDKVIEALDVAKEHNASLDISEFFSNEEKDFNHLRENDVNAIIADYDFKGNSGIGVIFIVDAFSKLNQQASVWVTFLNMDTKEVFFTERVMGEPGGAGLRNFWANSIYDIINKMRKKEFENWRKKHYRKF
jgi:hypothetical protein